MISTILIAALALQASSVDLSPSPPHAGTLEGLPLAFVENRGQWNAPARFVARRGAMTAYLEKGAIVLDLRREVTDETVQGLGLRLVFEGASDEVEIEGQDPQPGVRNYFYGSDPEKWVSAVPGYSQVLYRGLYEGVDLRVRDHAGRLEYDLLLAPGADLGPVVFRVEGSTDVAALEDGSLTMETECGPVRQSAPRTWYELPSGETEEVSCRFVALGERRYGFELPERKPGLPVVIDPGLEWSTFLGGDDDDQLFKIAIEPVNGYPIAAGRSYSTNYPTTPGAYQQNHTGDIEDAVVSCMDPNAVGAAQMVWSTFLGGSGRDRAMDLCLDEMGKVVVGGCTRSADFPTTPGAYDTAFGGAWDAFVVRLTANGSILDYSTYLGGSSHDLGAGIVHVGGDTVVVTGNTWSDDFPVEPNPGALQTTRAGDFDFFVAELELAGKGPKDLQYSTYLGGSSREGYPINNVYPNPSPAIGLGAGGEIVMACLSRSPDFPTTPNAYSQSWSGVGDCVVVRLDPAGSGPSDLLYSTYLGGSTDDGGVSLLVDSGDVIVVGGFTYSDDFPTTPGAYDEVYYGPPGWNDAFLLRLDTGLPPDKQLLYSTLFSGDGSDVVMAMTSDGQGGFIAGGFTGWSTFTSTIFPRTCGAWQPEFRGNQDTFVLQITPDGNGESDLLYSTLLGGRGWDGTSGLALVDPGSPPTVLGVGGIGATDHPTTHGAYQTDYGGGPQDGNLFRLELSPGPWTYCVAAPNSAGPGATIGSTGSLKIADNTFTLTVTGAIPNEFALFYYGKEWAQLPFGDGFRCVTSGGSGLYRLGPPQLANGSGTLQRLVDFTQPPAGSGPGRIDPGTAWNFQCWYRDPTGPGGTGFNYSDALRASFCP